MKLKRVLLAAAVLALAILAQIVVSPNVKAAGDADAAVGEKWAAAWNSHDPEKLLAAFTDDVVYEDVAFGEVSHGHAELRKFAAEEYEGVPDLQLKVDGVHVANGRGTIEWTFNGTDKGVYKTGKKFTVRGVSVIDVHEGKISRCLDFYDTGTIMRQVGVLPAQ
jgi:steroid delta-isomerase-like uncharacterized protein